MRDPRYAPDDNWPRRGPDNYAVATQTPTKPLGKAAAPRRWPWFLLGLTITLATTFVLLVGLVQSDALTLPFFDNNSTVLIPTATVPLPTVTPVPTAGPSAALRHSWALGCGAGKPKPPTYFIYTGLDPYLTNNKPAPHEVALTFDDGPTPYTSPAILDFLEQNHVPATFFVEGSYASLWPDLIKREWNDGFAIGEHSWDHPDLTLQTEAGLQHQLGDTDAALHKILGKSACLWLWRPPYGSVNRHVLNASAAYGLTTVTWDNSSGDWLRPGADKIAIAVLNQAHPGAIVLMHDGPADREETAQALPAIIAGLQARGLTPVTLPQLLMDGGYPGVSTQGPSATDGTPTPAPSPAAPNDQPWYNSGE